MAPSFDRNILQEHKFYDTGNIKHLLPLLQNQEYQTDVKDTETSNHLLIGCLIGLLICFFVIKKFKGTNANKRQTSLV